MGDKHEIARINILWFITQFCLSQSFGSENRVYPGLHAFEVDTDHNKVQVGDLVALSATPINEWYLSWLIDIKRGENHFYDRYLCESIETGELMWWRNVGISFMDREVRKDYPKWRWTDRQYAFNGRWNKACIKKCDAFIIMPSRPEFGEGFEVTLGVHERYGNEYNPTKTFPDWRKITKAMMAEFYNECVEAKS